jgi:hypothetical protein
MAEAVSYELDGPTPDRSILFQIAVTIFVGIPMTIALVIALVIYCTYECLKFALSTKPETAPQAQNASPSGADELKFTDSLATFASIHGVPQKVEVADEQNNAAQSQSARVESRSL